MFDMDAYMGHHMVKTLVTMHTKYPQSYPVGMRSHGHASDLHIHTQNQEGQCALEAYQSMILVLFNQPSIHLFASSKLVCYDRFT